MAWRLSKMPEYATMQCGRCGWRWTRLRETESVTFGWAMIAYWSIALLACLKLIALPAQAMYAGYGTALIDAWNWSFAPLDLVFAVLGLASLRLAAKGDPRWQATALASLALTFCAGLMAISFWALQGDFNPAWWLPNLALTAIGAGWGLALIRGHNTN